MPLTRLQQLQWLLQHCAREWDYGYVGAPNYWRVVDEFARPSTSLEPGVVAVQDMEQRTVEFQFENSNRWWHVKAEGMIVKKGMYP